VSEPTLVQRIENNYLDLSPQEQKAADFLLDHIADLAMYSATEVAQLSGVSKSTISRLYRRLGFDSAEELREHVRSLRNSGIPLATTSRPDMAVHLEHEFGNLRRALEVLELGPIADTIAAASRVVVIGFRNSYPLALHLRQQLAQARAGVTLAPAPGQSIGEDVAGLSDSDTIILVGFRRRPAGFAKLVAALSASSCSVVLITDPSGRRYAEDVTHAIECPLNSVNAFDSYAAASTIVNVLAAAVLGRSVTSGRERIADINQLYAELDEIER